MTCGLLHTKLDTAISAVKEVLKEALDSPDFDKDALDEMWMIHSRLTSVVDKLPQHNHDDESISIESPLDAPDISGYNFDLYKNDPLSGTVTFPVSEEAK